METSQESVSAIDLSLEHVEAGAALNVPSPRISWRFICSDSVRDWKQSAYEIEIQRLPSIESETFKVESDESNLVPWPSHPLKSKETARVRIRVYGGNSSDTSSTPSNWTPWMTAFAGIFDQNDWTAKLITASIKPESDAPIRPVRFQRRFDVSKSYGTSNCSARLYITAHGLYEVSLNGQRIGDHCLAPGWTSYHHRLHYQVFDVSEVCKQGENIISVEVAEGWYASRLTWLAGKRQIYGNRIGVIAQLEVSSDDKSIQQTVISDESWLWTKSAIIASEIYDGEMYDMREEQNGWKDGKITENEWSAVVVGDFQKSALVAPQSPPARVIEEIHPVEIFKSPSGKILLDFGQNLVGRLRVHILKKESGHRVEFRHAEVLEHGELGIRPLRSAKAIDTLICDGTEVINWSPKFTFHGFRYVEIEGWGPDDSNSPLTKENISAQIIHTDMTRTGYFKCSNSLVNQLHENTIWSMRGNFLSVPTDCPQRDERLGWTGDIQIFTPTANMLFNTTGMLGNWLEDLAYDQKAANGVVPLVIPDVLAGGNWPSVPQAVWDDAAILVPWYLYQWSGDSEILKRQYESMQSYLKSIYRGEDGLWDDNQWQLGDWLDPNAPPQEPGLARTSGSLVADAYLIHVTGLMAEISKVIGKIDESEGYTSESQKLKSTFQDKYIAPLGNVTSDTQTGLALVLAFKLYRTSEQAATAAKRLAHLVRYAKFRVSTGFAGTPIILHALSSGGYDNIAYRMLLEKKCPSWLYPVTMGATTIWERWDSMLEDGSINPGQMTSFNHYALGSVCSWLHETVGGISPLEPGWKKFKVRPVPGGTISNAEVTFESRYGTVKCSWELKQSQHFTLKLVVPPNTTAIVILPSEQKDIIADENGVELGSGLHEIGCEWDGGKDWPPKALYTEFRDSGDEDSTFA